MKKWFVGLMMLLALVLMQSTAMAFYKDAICPKCKVEREFVRTDDYCWIPKEDMHMRVYRCPVCDRRQGMGKMTPHVESEAATCVSAAYCALCKRYFGATDPNNHEYTIVYNKVDEKNHFKKEVCSGCKKLNTSLTEQHRQKEAATCVSGAICADCGEAYGSPNPNAHNWTEWQPHMSLPNVHYRYCQNSGCSAYETEPHDGNSNCVTSATCSKCKATYKDTTKHKGPLTYTYEKENESFHKKIESRTACGKRTGSFVSTKHEESASATCTKAAWCNVCNQAYGDPNPDNHGWGNWTYENENQHYRICSHNESHIQHADHRGYATCIESMPCLDCGCSYKDPDKHQGGTDFDYLNVSDNEHKVTVSCKGCHREINTYFEGHSEHTPATCSSRAICAKCSTPFGDLAPNNHIGEATTTYVKTSETQHTAKITYADCGHMVDGASIDHTETTAATCADAAYCAECESSYGDPDPDAHDLVQHDAQAATCTEIGWDAYEACSRCTYTTLQELLPKLVHWYGEWSPNADSTHSATCSRGCGDKRTVACASCTYQLGAGDAAAAITLCPVCGNVSDGTRLTLAENAAAAALTCALPSGELVARMGTLQSGETIVSIAFEIGGVLTQPIGQVKITLPGLLDGYALHLLHEDGTETLLTDVQDGSFVLEFPGASSPVRVIRLVPIE